VRRYVGEMWQIYIPTHAYTVLMLFKKIDLHNTTLYNAKLDICENLLEAHFLGNETIEFIHGYRNGQSIRNYIRKPGGLARDLKERYTELPEITIYFVSEGRSRILFKAENT
tara:strand:+ start:189 stop:524 length:336 start_codon:yes stop_codon:yes gene_type:complete